MAQTKKAKCLNDLQDRILRLDLAPGAELDESQVASEYGLSRTPLREVFQTLAGEGYLQIVQNRGARVASMDLNIMRTFFQTAPLIYATVARLAAEHRTPDQLAALKDIQHSFLAATRDDQPAKAAMHNHRFHALIGDMAQNAYLQPSLNRMLIDHTRLSQTFYRPGNTDERQLVEKAGRQHDHMIDAIENREPAVVVDLTLQHWDLSRDRMERFVQPDPLPLEFTSKPDTRHAV